MPVYKIVDIGELKLVVNTMTLNELIEFLKNRKNEEVKEIEIFGKKRLVILKHFDPQIIPISYLPMYIFCPGRVMNAVKLGQELGLGGKLVKVVVEDNLRRFVFGDLLHEEYVKKLVEKYGEDVIQSEVCIERDVGKFVLHGRCDIITIVDDELSIVEVKSKIYREPYEMQVSAYGHCLGTKSLYLVDIRSVVKVHRVKWKYVRDIAMKIHELFKMNFNVVKQDLERFRPSREKCKFCGYVPMCEIRRRFFPVLTMFTELKGDLWIGMRGIQW